MTLTEFEMAVQAAEQSTVIADVKADIIKTVQELSKNTLTALGTFLATAIVQNQKIYLTGMGKPSFVAMKNAMTLKSIEVDAEYLDACTAGHGDLGSMPKTVTLVVAMSKSGKTIGLDNLFANLASCRPNAKVVLLTFNRNLQELNDIYKDCIAKGQLTILSLNVDPGELDGFGLIPSSSNIGFEAAMSIGFAFAMTIAGKPIDLHYRLQRSHPDGTLQTKVSKIIAMEEEQK